MKILLGLGIEFYEGYFQILPPPKNHKGKNPAGLEGKRRPISKWWRKKNDTRGLEEKEKVMAQKEGYKVVTSVVLRRKGGVFSLKFFTLC